MSDQRPNSSSLQRCADAAGYAAVSWSADEFAAETDETLRARLLRIIRALVARFSA